MKVALINIKEAFGDPPLSLAYLASYLRKKNSNLEIKIFDKLNNKALIKRLKKYNPSIIGLTAVSNNYFKVKELGKLIKQELKEPILIIGGIHITISKNSFKNSPFDIGVIGEGEITFQKIVENIEMKKGIDLISLQKIKGILLKDNEKIIDTGKSELINNLDEIPIPARDLLNMNYYSSPRTIMTGGLGKCSSILTSRGCVYNCKFCSSSEFWGRKIRFFSAEKVIEDILDLYKNYKIDNIFIYDDVFNVNKERLKKIIELLEKENLLGKISFHCFGISKLFDEESAQLFKKLNVKSVIFGIESGSQKTLDYLKNKIIKVEDNKKALEICKKYNFFTGGFFMIGNPYENEEDIRETYEFIKNNDLDHFIVYQTIAYPGTKVWDYVVENNLLPEDFYDNPQKDFIDSDESILLSKNIDKNKFKGWFDKFSNMRKTNFTSQYLKHLKFKNIFYLFDYNFLKRIANQKHRIKKWFKL